MFNNTAEFLQFIWEGKSWERFNFYSFGVVYDIILKPQGCEKNNAAFYKSSITGGKYLES